MQDNDITLFDFIQIFGENLACILNKALNNDDFNRIMHIFFTIVKDIANGKKKPDKDFLQGMIALYKQNPAYIPESIRDYVKKLADTDNHTIVKALAQKPKTVSVEVTKAGTKMRDKEVLPSIYDGGELFKTGATGSKKNPKTIKTAITLTFEALQEWEGILPKNKRITPFVLEILTHCMTLYAAGNEYITTKMLFRQLNGGKEKTPTRSFYDAFYQALGVLACTRIEIDATQEVKAGYNKRDYYKGALLPNSIKGEEIITMNGSIIEDVIHFLGPSPLFEYAIAKGQISPILPEMYDIPNVNRTEENIVLIGYMTRAYASMINTHSTIKPIISYDTLYDYLGVEGSNEKQTYKNKAKIRATVREILTAWVENRLIKGFQELTEDNKPAKKGTKVAKVRLDLFTRKEFNSIHNSENILPPT